MKCPRCYADTFIVLTVEPPVAHLMGGKYTMWCETCGTTANTFNPEHGKLADIKTPKAMTGGI